MEQTTDKYLYGGVKIDWKRYVEEANIVMTREVRFLGLLVYSRRHVRPAGFVDSVLASFTGRPMQVPPATVERIKLF